MMQVHHLNISKFQNNNQTKFQLSKFYKKGDGRKVFGVKNNKHSDPCLGRATTDSNKENFLLRWPGIHPAGHEIQNDACVHLNISKLKSI